MPQLVKLLTHDSLVKFAIPVLFNICVDYGEGDEPALQYVSSNAMLIRTRSGSGM